MTAGYIEANATLRPTLEPVSTPADDPAIRTWERGAVAVSREDLLSLSRAKLNRLLRLRDGWDGHRAIGPTPTSVTVVNGVLERLVTDDGPTPQISPLPTGGVEVTWLVAGASLSIEASAGGVVEVLGEGAAGETYLEGEFPYWRADIILLDQARIFLEKISHEIEVRASHA